MTMARAFIDKGLEIVQKAGIDINNLPIDVTASTSDFIG